jgi:ribosomal protein L15
VSYFGGSQPSSHRQSNYSHRHQSHCAWGAGGNGSQHGNRGARGREGCVVVHEFYG